MNAGNYGNGLLNPNCSEPHGPRIKSGVTKEGAAFLVSLRLHARARSPILTPPRSPKSYFAHPTPKAPFLHYRAMLQAGR